MLGVVPEQTGEVEEERKHEERTRPTSTQRPAADMQRRPNTRGGAQTQRGTATCQETTPRTGASGTGSGSEGGPELHPACLRTARDEATRR